MSSDKKTAKNTSHKNYYFKFEHKLSLIPHIEKQITQFIQKLEPKVKDLDTESCRLLAKAIHLKIQKIQQFYDRNFTDYRAHMILRSKKLLHEFLIRHIEYLSFKDEPKQGPQNSPVMQGKAERQKKMRKNEQSKIKQKSPEKNKNKSRQLKSNVNKRIKTSASKDYLSKTQGLNSPQKNPKMNRMLIKNQEEYIKQTANMTSPNIKSPNLRSANTQKPNIIEKHGFKNGQTEKKVSKQEYIRYLRNKKK